MSAPEQAAETCGSCGAANPAGARFCGSCGGALTGTRPCPSCGEGNPVGQSFCNACGAELEQATGPPAAPGGAAPRGEPAELEGEHKQVTVLFADVRGSMEMSEQTDPEEWQRIMKRFYELLSEGVRRYEGIVDKFTGDGIMALFGAPVAYEDHAARACYAALRIGDLVAEYAGELRRSSGLNFSVRIGINSGEVIVGAIGEGERPEYTAVGHTVGLAQRMEALAEPGRAYLTEHAARLAEGYLELEDLGEFEIRGVSEPVHVHRLVGPGQARSRLDLSRERGLSHFVGRGDELEALERALERAEQGQGGVIGVVAEAGVGKSRLCYEFAERCRARGIDVYEAQAQAHAEAIPLLPVLQILRAYFGIDEQDSERVAREKIAGRLLLLDPDFADVLPLVFDFLAVPDPERPAPKVGAEARQRLLRGVIRRLYRAPGRTGVAVNVIEDLHWIDAASEVFLAEMAAAVEGTPTLAVVNFRPEYEADWTALPAYQRLTLRPLGPEATTELVAALAGDDPSLDGLAGELHERTGGNPFFVEELVRELVAAGALEGEPGAYRLTRSLERTEVPAEVQAILAARIDRLGESKALLQAAAVIGKETPEPALRLVSGLDGEAFEGQVRELLDSGLLFESEIYPERVLAFSHPLTHEVAYGSMLGDRRRAGHAAAARALIELNPDRLEELAALIAQHFEQGGEALEAAGWAARAAHWAGHSEPREAQRLWRKVTELVSGLPDSEETTALGLSSRIMQLDYAWRLGMESEVADRLYEEAEALAMAAGDLASLSLLSMLRTLSPGAGLRADAIIDACEESISLADRSGSETLTVAVRAASAYAYLRAGRFEEGVQVIDRALALAGDDATVGAGVIFSCPVASARMMKGMIRREQGAYGEAEELFETAIRLAGEHQDPEAESWARGNLSVLKAYRGDHDDAVATAQRNCEFAERLGDSFSRGWALVNLGYAYAARGDGELGVAALEQAQRLRLESGNEQREQEDWWAAVYAHALLVSGRVPEAIEAALGSVRASWEGGMRVALPGALRILAEARIAAGEPEAAEALDEADAVAREMGAGAELERIGVVRASIESHA